MSIKPCYAHSMYCKLVCFAGAGVSTSLALDYTNHSVKEEFQTEHV